MRINHNIAALNTHRQLGAASNSQMKNMERLSSGLRINRAGDDAAGLAISEKMRGQIRGLEMATKNSQDGISLIQTAEGALNETHSILQRMRELAVQASNDTNVSSDRTVIQDEMNQLVEEIDRISNATEFNTQKLLDGAFKGTFQIGSNEGQSLNLSISKMSSSSLGLSSSTTVETGVAVTDLKDGTYTVDGTDLKDANGNKVGTISTTDVLGTDNSTAIMSFANTPSDGSTITVKDGKAELRVELSGNGDKLSAGSYEINGTNVIKDGELVGTFDSGAGSITDLDGNVITSADLGFDTVILADTNKFTINGADISSGDKAAGTITAIDNAIKQVSAERSKLGAVQNRLEHTINNLSTSAENLTTAESRIRDVDYALAA